MGVPFQVDVNVVTHPEQVDALEKRLNALQSKGIDLKVKVDGLDKLDTSKMGKQFTTAGKQASQNFMNGVKSVKGSTSDLFGFAKDQKKTFDKISKDAEKVKTTLGYTNTESTTIAKSWHNTQEKAFKEAEKVRQDNVKKTQKAQEVENRRYAQQQIAQMKQTAVQRNAHNKAIVDSGKERITQLKQEQKIQKQINEKESTANLIATRKAEQSRNQSQIQQKISQLGYNNRLKNAHNQEIMDRIQQTRQKYESQQSQLAKIQQRATSGEFEARTAKNNSWIDKYAGQNSESLAKARKQIEEINSLQKELQTGKYASGDKKGMTIVSDDQIAKTEKLDKTCKELKNTMTQVAKEESKTLGQGIAERSANSVATYMESNTKALKKYGEQLATLQQQYKSATTEFEKSDLDNQFKNLKSRISAEGLTGRSGWDEFKRAGKQIAQFAGIYGAIQNIGMQIPSQMIGAVKDVNAAQIELTKVSDASGSQLTKYWSEASDSAQKYGSTISDVISSTADWSRLGYSLDDAKKLSDVTTLLQKVGDNMTQESSSQGLISTLKGFKMEADEASKVVDVVNEVANTEPIDTAGIFDGLTRSASSMKAANNTFEETVALITAANSVVQDPDSVGTAFKTISMRIRGADTELQQAGLDTEGMAESTAKLRQEVMALSGVDIMKNENEFKSTYDILDELSTKWSDLTDIQQASLTELIAGKRQGNIVSSLMTNFDVARKSLQTALNDADGSGERELEAWNQGIEASISHLQASLQKLSVDTISSDFFKGIVDSGTNVVNTIDNITSSIGLLNTAAIGLGIFQGKNNSGESTWDSPHAFFKTTYAA